MMLVFFIAGILEWEWLTRISGKSWISANVTIVDCFYSAAFLLTFLAFDQANIPGVKILNNLGTKSFGVYLMHSLVLLFASKIIYHFFPVLLQYQILFQPILISLGLMVPVGIMALVERSPANRFYGYLFVVKRLLVLNGLAIIGAVIHHSAHWILTSMFYWTDKYRPVAVPNFDQINGISYYFLRIIDQFAYPGIAAFLFISGTFIAIVTGRNQTSVSWNIVFSRIKRLLIPYLLWSCLILVANSLQGQELNAWKLVNIFLKGEATTSYYYVPMLIIFLLLSPFIAPFAKSRWRMLLLVCALIQGTITLMRYASLMGFDVSSSPVIRSLIWNFHVPANIFWFAFGMVAGFRLHEFELWLTRNRKVFAFGFVVTLILSLIEWDYLLRLSGREWLASQIGLFAQAFIFFLLVFFLGFDSTFLLRFRLFSKISSQSYGIYLVHEPAMEYTARLIYHIAPWFLGYFIPLQALLVSAGIGAPLLAMEIVNRSPARRFYRYIFG
jgi:peptidoglycan/LPS O-acetylase OafA/YrhL